MLTARHDWIGHRRPSPNTDPGSIEYIPAATDLDFTRYLFDRFSTLLPDSPAMPASLVAFAGRDGAAATTAPGRDMVGMPAGDAEVCCKLLLCMST